MLRYVMHIEQQPLVKSGQKEVHVDEAFDDLLQYILKIDEITNLDSSQIEHEEVFVNRYIVNVSFII